MYGVYIRELVKDLARCGGSIASRCQSLRCEIGKGTQHEIAPMRADIVFRIKALDVIVHAHAVQNVEAVRRIGFSVIARKKSRRIGLVSQ
jgi:hypothetical protein